MANLQSADNNFFSQVYRKGLFDLIDQNDSSGMSGTIGTCRVLSFRSGGRLRITFTQPGPGGRDKCSYTIIGRDDDRNGDSFNADSREGSDADITAMLVSLVRSWPSRRDQQAQIFRPGNTFLGVARRGDR